MNVQTPPSPQSTPPGSPLRPLSTSSATPNRWPKLESNHAGQPPFAQAAGAIAANHQTSLLSTVAYLSLGAAMGFLTSVALTEEAQQPGAALPESGKQQIFAGFVSSMVGLVALVASQHR